MNSAEKAANSLQITIGKGLIALFLLLPKYLEKGIDLERISRVSVLLLKCGADKQNSMFQRIVQRCLTEQKADGGWIAVEDSAWSIGLLKEYMQHSEAYSHGLSWIKGQQHPDGSWGKSNRDIGRITITGFMLHVLPELFDKSSSKWLEDEWRKEFSSNIKLTYKCAFSLMGTKAGGFGFADSKLFENSLDWLVMQQNQDHGWGPFKGHPVGSTPFCTGVALAGLLQYPNAIDKAVIVDGLKWIEKNQLENGLWPDHYIEEGSAWIFYALTEGYKFLKAHQ